MTYGRIMSEAASRAAIKRLRNAPTLTESIGQYATAEETAAVVRRATPDEVWLEAQLNRIDPHRHEMGGAGDVAALTKLVMELRS